MDRPVKNSAISKGISLLLLLALLLCISIPAYAETSESIIRVQATRYAVKFPRKIRAGTQLDSLKRHVKVLEFHAPAALVKPRRKQARLKGLDAEFIPYNARNDFCKRLKRQVALLNRRLKVRKEAADDGVKLRSMWTCSANAEIVVERTSNDNYYSRLWGLYQSNRIDMRAPEAWETTTGSNSVVVAVIDTGIDYTHSDLSTNAWRNPGETAGNGIDDDGNGYIDDIYGIDTANGDTNPMDDHGHGTHCAGTIGAAGNNTVGVVGVNWNVKLMGLKFLSASGSGTTAGAIFALQYANTMKQRGIPLVLTSNSWGGGGFSATLLETIQRSNDLGILFVAAAGNATNNNDARAYYPANYNSANVITVAAIDSNGNLASFSNYGAVQVDIAAPGVSILSTYPGNRYAYMSGTSMATPHVSGALALLAGYSNYSGAALKSLLLANGRVLPSLHGLVSSSAIPNMEAMIAASPAESEPDPSEGDEDEIVPATITISGSIVNGRGVPIRGARVKIVTVNPDDEVSRTSIVTDIDGLFSFAEIVEGSDYLVTVTRARTRFRPARLAGTAATNDITHTFVGKITARDESRRN